MQSVYCLFIGRYKQNKLAFFSSPRRDIMDKKICEANNFFMLCFFSCIRFTYYHRCILHIFEESKLNIVLK